MTDDCRTTVVIPTYDERENVERMAKAVLSIPGVKLLFVDDNSPDGTGKIIDSIAEREKRVTCLHRAGKEGLGRAYVAGFAAIVDGGKQHHEQQREGDDDDGTQEHETGVAVA